MLVCGQAQHLPNFFLNRSQLLDVFSNKSNLNLVLEFLDTDLEAVIKDNALVFQGADIKSWMLMTMKGLEFCHRNWILHRVRRRALLIRQGPRNSARCRPLHRI